MQFGSDDLAKYTFLPEAGDFVRAQGIELSDLSGPDYRRIVDRARERVVQAIREKTISDQVEKQRETEIMSFPISLVLVRATNLDHLMSIYASAEARRVEHFLSRESNPRIVEDIFRNFLGVQLEHADGKAAPLQSHLPKFRIPVSDYAKRASSFRDPEWRLVNRVMANGRVYLAQDDLIRLIREEIKALILQRLKAIKIGKLPQNLQEISKELASLAPPPRLAPSILNVSPENYPPCVVEALRLLEKGENVPHYGRFLMATYLLKVGKSVDEIVALFPKSPDFKQNVTRYQVEHIAGLKGGRTRYSVPSCRTLQTHSFCFMDPVKCYGISSPLQYPSRIKKPEEEEGGGRGRRRSARGEGAHSRGGEGGRRRAEWTKPRR